MVLSKEVFLIEATLFFFNFSIPYDETFSFPIRNVLQIHHPYRRASRHGRTYHAQLWALCACSKKQRQWNCRRAAYVVFPFKTSRTSENLYPGLPDFTGNAHQRHKSSQPFCGTHWKHPQKKHAHANVFQPCFGYIAGGSALRDHSPFFCFRHGTHRAWRFDRQPFIPYLGRTIQNFSFFGIYLFDFVYSGNKSRFAIPRRRTQSYFLLWERTHGLCGKCQTVHTPAPPLRHKFHFIRSAPRHYRPQHFRTPYFVLSSFEK